MLPELANLYTLRFNVFEIPRDRVPEVVITLFDTFFTRCNIDKPDQFDCFVNSVCLKYNNVPYHSVYHALQVLNVTWALAEKCDLFNKLNHHILFATLISAFVHDIGHPGTNNKFQQQTKSEIYTLYGPTSTLELFHIDQANIYLEEYNILYNFSTTYKEIVDTVITECLIATDPGKHSNIFSEIKKYSFCKRVNENGDEEYVIEKINYENIDDQITIAKYLVLAADLSNPILHYELYGRWATKVQDEFRRQSISEEMLGLEKSFQLDYAFSFRMELNYISHIMPFWKRLTSILPQLEDEYNTLLFNYKTYKQILC
jgi:hypothetical protein